LSRLTGENSGTQSKTPVKRVASDHSPGETTPSNTGVDPYQDSVMGRRIAPGAGCSGFWIATERHPAPPTSKTDRPTKQAHAIRLPP